MHDSTMSIQKLFRGYERQILKAAIKERGRISII